MPVPKAQRAKPRAEKAWASSPPWPPAGKRLSPQVPTSLGYKLPSCYRAVVVLTYDAATRERRCELVTVCECCSFVPVSTLGSTSFRWNCRLAELLIPDIRQSGTAGRSQLRGRPARYGYCTVLCLADGGAGCGSVLGPCWAFTCNCVGGLRFVSSVSVNTAGNQSTRMVINQSITYLPPVASMHHNATLRSRLLCRSCPGWTTPSKGCREQSERNTSATSRWCSGR